MKVLSRLFRRLFLEHLQRAFDAGKLQFFGQLEHLADPQAFACYLAPLKSTQWVVYAKRPFAGPKQVLRYLGRYTHRVAISNNRLLGDADGKVSFDWKDYKNGSAHKIMTLEADEFIRRFLLHVLPKGLQRIRHFGFLGNRYREQNVAKVRELLGQKPAPSTHPDKDMDYRERYEQLTGHSLLQCPACRRGQMLLTRTLPSPSPHLAPDSS